MYSARVANKPFFIYVYLIIITGIVHFMWESAHVHLYGGYEHIAPKTYIVWYATAGDILYTLLIAGLYSIKKRTILWPISIVKKDYFFLTLLGGIIAVFVEYKALITHKWYYLSNMPLIPILNIGLSPVMQMTLLTPLIFFLVHSTLANRGARELLEKKGRPFSRD